MPALKSPDRKPLAQMRQVVQQELDHIPRWPKATQSLLRQVYWFYRMNSLGKKAELPNDRFAVLRKCLEELAKDHPDAEFHYDRSFFSPISESELAGRRDR